ncbi:MAG: hypothetical protein ACKESB_00905 [Candidatus Hodgkinia cicadicola]
MRVLVLLLGSDNKISKFLDKKCFDISVAAHLFELLSRSNFNALKAQAWG